MARLWDARNADLTGLTREDFRLIGDAARATELSSPGVRVAFLVARDVDFGIGQAFRVLGGGDPAGVHARIS